MYLVLAVLVLIAVIAGLLVRSGDREQRLARNRPGQLRDVAEQLKLEVLELQGEEIKTASEKLLAGSRLYSLVTAPESGFRHVLCGALDGHQVTLFDCRGPAVGDKPARLFTVLVVRAPSTSLPRFDLQPAGPPDESATTAVDDVAGFRSVSFDSTLLDESFALRVHPEDNQRVAHLLSGPARDFLEARLDLRLHVESKADRLLIYAERHLVPASRLEGLLRQSAGLAAALAH